MQARTLAREKGEDRKPGEAGIEHSAYVSCVSAEMSSGMEPVTPDSDVSSSRLHVQHRKPAATSRGEARIASARSAQEATRDARLAPPRTHVRCANTAMPVGKVVAVTAPLTEMVMLLLTPRRHNAPPRNDQLSTWECSAAVLHDSLH
jgi:hypothetical protein